jgi:hypothetical protein
MQERGMVTAISFSEKMNLYHMRFKGHADAGNRLCATNNGNPIQHQEMFLYMIHLATFTTHLKTWNNKS